MQSEGDGRIERTRELVQGKQDERVMADIQRQTYGLETKLWWTMLQSGRDLNMSRFEKKKATRSMKEIKSRRVFSHSVSLTMIKAVAADSTAEDKLNMLL